MIKAAVIDLDGTLFLNHGNTIFDLSKESEAAIQLLKDQGVKIYIASGRAPEYSKRLYQKYKLGEPTFCGFNGSIIYQNNLLKEAFLLEKADVKDIYQALKDCPYAYRTSFVQTENGNRAMEVIGDKSYDIYKHIAEKEAMNLKVMDIPYYEYIDTSDEKSAKFSIIAENNEDANKIYQYLKERFSDRFTISTSTVIYIEVTNNDSNKGKFIDFLMKEYGYQADEIAVMGDSYNDYSMLKKVKYNYVMNHGEKDLINSCYLGVENVLEASMDIVRINDEIKK